MKTILAALAVLIGLGVFWPDRAAGHGSDLRRIGLDSRVPSSSMSHGPLTVTLSIDVQSGDFTPIMTLHHDDKLVLEAKGTSNGSSTPHGHVTFAEMDAGNPFPEIVFNTHPGGTGCCKDLVIATSSEDGKSWSQIRMALPGISEPLGDADRDGLYELGARDYAFVARDLDCSACDNAPLVIYSLSRGEIVEVTREPRFLWAHRHEVKRMESIARKNDTEPTPSWLISWAAQKTLVGEGEDAMRHVERVHDRKAFPDFPARLRMFLKDTGYLP